MGHESARHLSPPRIPVGRVPRPGVPVAIQLVAGSPPWHRPHSFVQRLWAGSSIVQRALDTRWLTERGVPSIRQATAPRARRLQRPADQPLHPRQIRQMLLRILLQRNCGIFRLRCRACCAADRRNSVWWKAGPDSRIAASCALRALVKNSGKDHVVARGIALPSISETAPVATSPCDNTANAELHRSL